MEVVDREKWHVGKEIPLAVIVMLIGVVLAQYVGWKIFQASVDSYIASTDDKFLELHASNNRRDVQFLRLLDERTNDRISKAEVVQMFVVKDVQIEALTNSIDRLYEASVSNNAVLQEILRSGGGD